MASCYGRRRRLMPFGAPSEHAIDLVNLANLANLANLRRIPTPWVPYAMVFSPDGSRLAIGGGTYDGGGGIMLVDHASRQRRIFSGEDLPQLGGGTVSGLCFSADARHLVASVWGSRQHGGRVAVFEVDGLELGHGHVIEIDYS